MAYREYPAGWPPPERSWRGSGAPQPRRGAAYEVHALYVALADKSPAGRQAAEYLGGAAAPLGEQGIAVEVYRVRPKDLRNRRVLDAFRRRGIDRLPAALARGRPLVGFAEIRAYYAGLAKGPHSASEPREARAPFAFAERGPPAPRASGAPAPDEGDSPEADLEDYFRQEILGGRGGDDSDTGFGAA